MKICNWGIVIFSVTFAFVVFACATAGKQTIGGDGVALAPPPAETTLLPRQAGEFLQIYPLNVKYSGICDNFGMNGAQGRNQWHSNDPKTMFAAEKQDFVFDISFRIEQLGELYIWNYNEIGRTESGIRNIIISISDDNTAYTELGAFELKQADGSEKLLATNLNDGSLVDFAGKSARFIKLSPVDNYGGDNFGLSEVRVFRYKQDVYKGAYISATPLERYSNKSFISSAESYNLTNGAGLSDPFSADATHNNNPNHMYLVRDPKVAGFPIDLKGKYPVEKIVIWNYNDSMHTDYGLQTIGISYSEDGIKWKQIPEKYTLPRASGQNGLAPSLVINKPFYARYLRIDNLKTYGGGRAGLSAVRCYVGEGWFADTASDWTAMLSNYNGWCGADGYYTASLDGRIYAPDRDPADMTVFMHFGDTGIAQVNPFTNFIRGFYMPNNTAAILHGGFPDTTKIKFIYPTRNEKKAFIVPNPPEKVSYEGDNKDKWYWLGPSFVIGDKLYILANKVDQRSEGAWGFWGDGCDLARFTILNGEVDYSSLKLTRDNADRLCGDSPGCTWSLSAGVFVNTEQAGAFNPDGYIYYYGWMDKRGKRHTILARAKAAQVEDFFSYEYLMEDDIWVNRIPKKPKFKSLSIYGGTELSVSELKTGPDKGKFILVATPGTIADEIQISVASSLTEGFSNPQIIFHTDMGRALPYPNCFTSNAKAHPVISNDRELIISYNVNGEEGFTYGDIYRPRFIRFARVPVLQ